MTEEYKKNLIDYATGNLQSGTPTADEIIKEQIEVDRNKWKDFIPSSWTDFHYEGCVQDKATGNLILYGGYRATGSTAINDQVYGIITILDNEFNPIKSFFEFDSGTKLRYIQTLKQAEDYTYYMVDDTIFANSYNDLITTSTKRFIMLNNFTSTLDEKYKLILRKSYTFPNGYNLFKCRNLEKNPNYAQYVMVGEKYTDAFNSYTGLWCIELNIPYGESPSWSKTNIVAGDSGYPFNTSFYITSLISFNEDKYSTKIFGAHNYRQSSGSTLYHYIRYYYKNYNSNTYSTNDVLNIPDFLGQSAQYSNLENQGIFLNENSVYFILSNLEGVNYGTNNLEINLYNYNIENDLLSLIYKKSYGTAVASHNEQIYLSQNQGELYIEQIINKGNNLADYYFQRYNNEWNPILVGENKPYVWNQRDIFTINKYNLLEIFLYPSNPRKATWYFPIIKEIYNPTNYNGEPYVNVDALSPLYSNLYSNGSLVFSRNLYNISKQNNMTMSSVEIPNTYLNDTNITQNDLISETNLELVNDTTNWTKNIYEVVDVNFLNTIRVIDEDTGTEYIDSAIKLNNATVDGGETNYQNTPCNKFRINYTDNTTKIISVNWSSIDNTHKETLITFYVDKEINNIDLISNDETTIYLTIPVEVEVNKYYSISQKIRIE